MYAAWLKDLRMTDLDKVGGKNASLGEMMAGLSEAGIRVPGGFATTAEAYRAFLARDGLDARIRDRLRGLDPSDVEALAKCGKEIRGWIERAPFPEDVENTIREYFQKVESSNSSKTSYAIRSSATAEDLPDASFAGQQETFLNIEQIDNVLEAIRQVFASLYNDRAISYRVHHGFEHSQVALSAALLVGSGLLVRSMIGLSRVDLGFDPDSLLTGQLQVQVADYPTPGERNAFYTSLLEEVEALPGVEAATLSNRLPLVSRWQDWSVWPTGQEPGSPQDELSAMARWVAPGYFETMGIPFDRGRDIAATDVPGSPDVVVVSRGVAEALFPGADPLGHTVTIGDWRDCEIVGVVEDAHLNDLRGAPDPAVYMSLAQMGQARMQIAVRTTLDPAALVRPIRELLRRKDPDVLFARPRTMSSVVAAELAGFRTMVFPVATQMGAIQPCGIIAGKFHGPIPAKTPMGWL